MDTHTSDLEIEPSGEQISTPEELKERQRIQDIMSARRDARNSFIEVTTVELEARERGYQATRANEIAARYVHRHVTSYVEELAYHLQTTDAGQYYWNEVALGQVTPRSPDHSTDIPGWAPPQSDPEPVELVGLSEYLALGEEVTYEPPTDPLEEADTQATVTAVPIRVSRVAFRATNHFAEELLGLELSSEQDHIVNFSLASDGTNLNEYE